MRQVPYLVIGAGRMATHFCHYLSLLNLPFIQWARRTHTHRQLESYLELANPILLLIKDDEIVSFSKTIFRSDKTFVHFSGQLVLQDVYGAHPLMSFADDLYSKELYMSVPYILEEGSLPFTVMLPGLPNPYYHIPKSQKSFYHALCVISNNFTCLLWKKIFDELSKTLGLPVQVAMPYLQQTFRNIENNPTGKITGPLARGDEVTIQKHLEALAKDEFEGIYKAFVNFYRRGHQ
ncbi:MAG: DUF2520 domain-containing protein [Gammaproteobacteria bacterium]